MINRLKMLFHKVPNRYFDPETGEEFLRIPPVRWNIGVNLRPILMVKAKDLEASQRAWPDGFDPTLAHYIYKTEGLDGVERYWQDLSREDPDDDAR